MTDKIISDEEYFLDACQSGDCDKILTLVNSGVNVNLRNGLPLAIAVHKERANAVDTLIKLGADTDVFNEF